MDVETGKSINMLAKFLQGCGRQDAPGELKNINLVCAPFSLASQSINQKTFEMS